MRLAYVLDCVDPLTLARFWSRALGLRPGRLHPPYLRLRDPRDRLPDLLLQQVPEPKQGKNRMHLDIQVTELASELERLRGLGAAVVAGPADDAGYLIGVLVDPQGNEFCVVQPPPGTADWARLMAQC